MRGGGDVEVYFEVMVCLTSLINGCSNKDSCQDEHNYLGRRPVFDVSTEKEREQGWREMKEERKKQRQREKTLKDYLMFL